MSEVFQINRRAKAGHGKTLSGLTAKKLAELSSLQTNVEIQKAATESQFFKFTRIYVALARDLARSGQKDAARNWHRYFQNAKVLRVVHSHGSVEASSVGELAAELQKLGTECHPQDVADWETDIQAIRACLEYIVENLPRKNHGKKKNGESLHRLTSSFEASISYRDRKMGRNII